MSWWTLTLRSMRTEIPETVRLRKVLKTLLRAYNFRCVDIRCNQGRGEEGEKRFLEPLPGSGDNRTSMLFRRRAVRQATVGYRADQDLIGRFIAEQCVTGLNLIAAAGQLYEGFKIWCALSGETAWSQRRFGESLSEHGCVQARDSATGRTVWKGIGILAPAEPSEPSEP